MKLVSYIHTGNERRREEREEKPNRNCGKHDSLFFFSKKGLQFEFLCFFVLFLNLWTGKRFHHVV